MKLLHKYGERVRYCQCLGWRDGVASARHSLNCLIDVAESARLVAIAVRTQEDDLPSGHRVT